LLFLTPEHIDVNDFFPCWVGYQAGLELLNGGTLDSVLESEFIFTPSQKAIIAVGVLCGLNPFTEREWDIAGFVQK
jgi:hypothetical protein